MGKKSKRHNAYQEKTATRDHKGNLLKSPPASLNTITRKKAEPVVEASTSSKSPERRTSRTRAQDGRVETRERSYQRSFSGDSQSCKDDRKTRKHGPGRGKSERFSSPPVRQNARFRIQIVEGNLFDSPTEYALAHCVAEDMNMGAGIAVEFRQRFKRTGVLLDQNKSTGDVAILNNKDRYIYYLVTKQWSQGKPTYKSLQSSLERMKDHMIEHSVTKLAMPKIGSGLDQLDWNLVKDIITDVFKITDIEIVIYSLKSPTSKRLNGGNVVIRTGNLTDIDPNGTILTYLMSVDSDSIPPGIVAQLEKKFNISIRPSSSGGQRQLGDVVTHETGSQDMLIFGLVCLDGRRLSYAALEDALWNVKRHPAAGKFEFIGVEVPYPDEMVAKIFRHIFQYTLVNFESWIYHPGYDTKYRWGY